MAGKRYIGLDIGGSKIEAILWQRGKVLRSIKVKTPQTKRQFFSTLFKVIEDIAANDKFSGIGIAVAGALDHKLELIYKSPNLPFLNGVRLGKLIERKMRTRVRFDNDTNCFLRAEARIGQGRDKKNIVALTIGTGVGGAVISEGEFIIGTHGSAAELGHMIISKEKNKFMSAEALVSKHGFRRLGVKKPLDAQNKAFAGDKKSIEVYREIGKFLGLALANFINIFDPEIIILGGGISRARELLLVPAKREMSKHVLLPRNKLPRVVVSKLAHAGAIGAALLF